MWAQKGCFGPIWTSLEALWHTHMALLDPQNCWNASPWMCPDLFHPCSTLFHQFGATRLAYGPKRPFLAVLDPVWPYNWPKWLEQEWSLVEQVNPYQNEAENIIGRHGKQTSKKPPSLTHCTMRLSPLQSVNRTIYQNVYLTPHFFSSSIISDVKYLKKIFDHFHFRCIFDHLSHEQS